MRAFAILRVGAKIKALGGLAKITAHNGRTRAVGNADAKRRGENRVLAGTGDAVADVEARLDAVPAKGRRRDSVLAFEVLTAVSSEWCDAATEAQRELWASAQLHAMEQLFGTGNVVCGWLHRDERADHAHWIIVPIDREGERNRGPKVRLNAKRWLGGPERLRQLQDDYAALMAPHGLVRGRTRSGERHKPARVWQAEQAAAAKAAWKAAEETRAATAEAMAERKRARALRVGVEAVADGLIVGAGKGSEGQKLVMFANKAEPAVIDRTARRIAIVWDEVWELARRIEARARRVVDRAKAEAAKLLEGVDMAVEDARRLHLVLTDAELRQAERVAQLTALVRPASIRAGDAGLDGPRPVQKRFGLCDRRDRQG